MDDKLLIFNSWERAAFLLKAAKALESDLRVRLCQLLLADSPRGVGRFDFVIADNEVRVSVSESVSLDMAEYDIHKDMFTDAEKGCLEFTAKVKKISLKTLPKDSILLTECLEKKHSKPTVEIISVGDNDAR